MFLYDYRCQCNCNCCNSSSRYSRPYDATQFLFFFFFFFHLVRFHLLGRIWVWFGLVWKMGREDHENIRMDLFPFAMRCD